MNFESIVDSENPAEEPAQPADAAPVTPPEAEMPQEAPAAQAPAPELQPEAQPEPVAAEVEAAVTEAPADETVEAVAEADVPLEATPAQLVPEMQADQPEATAIAEQDAPAEAVTEAAPAEAPAGEEDFVIAVPKRKKAAPKEKSDKPKAPRKPSSKKEKLPDPGDGSGYEAPQTAEGEDATEGTHWYAVHCYSGYENKVKHNLEQRIETMGMAGKIIEVVVPTEDEIEVRDGKRRTVERRVFPGYVMVHMKMSEESWHVVRNTPGVTRFIGMGNRPQPLSQGEVNQILRRMEAEAPKIKVSFRVGQKVRITDGPFADFMGLVDKIDMERAKVSVLVSFFGRETPVELDFLQVEKM
jgi:transcriptional antiterminator NusG